MIKRQMGQTVDMVWLASFPVPTQLFNTYDVAIISYTHKDKETALRAV